MRTYKRQSLFHPSDNNPEKSHKLMQVFLAKVINLQISFNARDPSLVILWNIIEIAELGIFSLKIRTELFDNFKYLLGVFFDSCKCAYELI